MTDKNSAIETGADLEDVVSVVHSICATDDGVLAALELTGETADTCLARLVQLNAKGRRPKVLAEKGLADGAEDFGAAPMSALPASGEGLLIWHDGAALSAQSLGAEKPALEKAAAKIDGGAVGKLAVNDAFAAAVVESFDDEGALSQAVVFAKTTLKGPTFKPLDIAALGLTETRQITAIGLLGKQVYVAVSDAVAGFDLFAKDLSKTAAEFEPVLTRGAYRFAINAAITCIVPDGDTLLIGTAALATGAPPYGIWGGEVIRLEADGEWQLVFGQQRLTPVGLKQPVSGLGAGIEGFDNMGVKAIAVDGDALYVALQAYLGDPEADRSQVVPDMFSYYGDMRLYRAETVESWVELDHGLDPEAGAVTALCATKGGVLVAHEGIGGADVPVTFVAAD